MVKLHGAFIKMDVHPVMVIRIMDVSMSKNGGGDGDPS